jgi:SAM-dependent methyltransferase
MQPVTLHSLNGPAVLRDQFEQMGEIFGPCRAWVVKLPTHPVLLGQRGLALICREVPTICSKHLLMAPEMQVRDRGQPRYGPAVDDQDGYFDERVAAEYDDAEDDMFAAATVNATVDVLAELAGPGPALELGIGTGRIALPLAQRGVPVHGIDMSRAMVARLKAKPGGGAIGVTIGDFATARVDGTFSLVYLVFNTISNLTSQEAQVACFRNAAAHLAPGGCFLIENGVPDLRRLPPGQTAVPFEVSPNRWAFDNYDVATQSMSSNYFVLGPDGQGEYTSMPFRYVWPAELDLMAQLAGMRLRDRWEGWTRQPFTSESRSHVSVWEKPVQA